MPNWCSVTYACITKDEKEAKKLYNAIYSMDKSRNPLAESDFGKLWLGCFVKQLGGDEGKIRMMNCSRSSHVCMTKTNNLMGGSTPLSLIPKTSRL